MALSRPAAAPRPRDPRPLRRVRSSIRAGLVWGVAAAAVNTLLSLLARAAGVPLRVRIGPEAAPVTVGPLIVIGATLFAALVGGLAAGLIGKAMRKPGWLIGLGGALFTAASLTAPWGQPPEVPVATKIVLTLLHVITGATVTVGLLRGMATDDRRARLTD